MTRRVRVRGVSAISAFGPTWRGLGSALRAKAPLPGVPPEVRLVHPNARNARKMMSRGAYLAAHALGELMRGVGWTPEERERAGYFLGVGASGGSLDDVTALLDASIVATPASPAAFSLAAFGEHGLAACNPLLAFQLMNNFTLAHGAIFEGLGGPNGALFSRGSGTTAALIEAVHAIASGDCDRAVAGGADSATHPVTRAELAREGFLERGLVPSEGAALLALSVESPEPSPARDLNVWIEGGAIANGHGRTLAATIDDAVNRAALGAADTATSPSAAGSAEMASAATAGSTSSATNPDVMGSAGSTTAGVDPTAGDRGATKSGDRQAGDELRVAANDNVSIRDLVEHIDQRRARDARDALFDDIDLVVIAPWGPPVLDTVASWARAHCPTARIIDTAALGATLAASPALAWIAAIDLLSAGTHRRALVLDAGVDGDVGAVLLRGGER